MTLTPARRGFLRNAMNTLIAAREREAARHVAGILLSLDDSRLAKLGYVRAELEKSGRGY